MTKKYFSVFDVSALQEGEQPPDYKLPYHEAMLWFFMIRSFLIGVAITAATFYMFIVAVDFGVGWMGAIIIGAVVMSSWLYAVLTPYLLFWEWKNRPFTVSASNAQLTVIQTLPKDWRRWVLAPFLSSSADDLVPLTKGYTTPRQKLWQQLLVHCDTLIVEGHAPLEGGRLIGLLKLGLRKKDKVLTLQYVLNMEHINRIVSYVTSLERQSVADQKELLKEIRDILQSNSEGDKVTDEKKLSELLKPLGYSLSSDEDPTAPPEDNN